MSSSTRCILRATARMWCAGSAGFAAIGRLPCGPCRGFAPRARVGSGTRSPACALEDTRQPPAQPGAGCRNAAAAARLDVAAPALAMDACGARRLLVSPIVASIVDVLRKPKDVLLVQHLTGSGRSAAVRFAQVGFSFACLPYEAFFSLDGDRAHALPDAFQPQTALGMEPCGHAWTAFGSCRVLSHHVARALRCPWQRSSFSLNFGPRHCHRRTHPGPVVRGSGPGLVVKPARCHAVLPS
jgi:hypothetical protein